MNNKTTNSHSYNFNMDNCEDYFRCSVFNKLLDEIICDLRDRFNSPTCNAI